MADFIPIEGRPVRHLATPLTLTALQRAVGVGRVHAVELLTGDLMVTSETATVLNPTASLFAGPAGPVYGDAILCDPLDLA